MTALDRSLHVFQFCLRHHKQHERGELEQELENRIWLGKR